MQSLTQYSLMTPERRKSLLEQVRERLSSAGPADTITAGFVDWARKEPERTAIVLDARHLQYEDVCQAYLRTRAKLAALGAGNGTPVFVDVPKPVELAVVVLALLDLGAEICVADRAESSGVEASNKTQIRVNGSPHNELDPGCRSRGPR
jgi:non-ribosomal peptide synthetase component E (peptide arylation enzyme)